MSFQRGFSFYPAEEEEEKMDLLCSEIFSPAAAFSDMGKWGLWS
jgi:hypothetical protein